MTDPKYDEDNVNSYLISEIPYFRPQDPMKLLEN